MKKNHIDLELFDANYWVKQVICERERAREMDIGWFGCCVTFLGL